MVKILSINFCIFLFSYAISQPEFKSQNQNLPQMASDKDVPTDHNLRALLHECLRHHLYDYYGLGTVHIDYLLICNLEDLNNKGVLFVPYQTYNHALHWVLSDYDVELIDSIHISTSLRTLEFNLDLPVVKRDILDNKFIFKHDEMAYYIFSDMFLDKKGNYYIALTYGPHLCLTSSGKLDEDQVFDFYSFTAVYEIEKCVLSGRFRPKRVIAGGGGTLIDGVLTPNTFEIESSGCKGM